MLLTDPDRWLIEWSYRVMDVMDSIDDLGAFLEGLMIKWLKAHKVPPRTSALDPRLRVPKKVVLVEFAVGVYLSHPG